MKRLIILLLIASTLAGCSKAITGHECRWQHCPYKGVIQGKFEQAVRCYTDCEEGSDGYYIDLLHLQYPEDDYDQLEARLFNQ